jgi:endonuclease/exonuclease/phosphatase family metal-dependent hydrolase
MDFINGGNYDFVDVTLKNRALTKNSLSWLISDHYPLWAEFKV